MNMSKLIVELEKKELPGVATNFTAALREEANKVIPGIVGALAEKYGFDEEEAMGMIEIDIKTVGGVHSKDMAADNSDTNGDNLILYVNNLNNILNTKSPLTLRELIITANDKGFKNLWKGLKTVEEVDLVFRNNKTYDKGLCGKLLEYALFGNLPNSSPEPDLNDNGDIKTNKWGKLKKQNSYRATERIKIGSVGNTDDYTSFNHIQDCDNITELRKYEKMKRGIIPIFDRQKNKCSTLDDAMSLRLLYVAMYNLDDLDYHDILNNDLRNIQDKIRTRNASQKGQQFLHLHTQGQGRGKNGGRALGYTPRFVTTLIAESIARDKNTNIESVLCKSGRSLYINNAFLK